MSDIQTAPPPPAETTPEAAPESTQELGTPEFQKRRRAAAVLEVLGGAKSPAEAAEGLGIALPSYYLLEARALEGLVSACEPRHRGRAAGGEGKSVQALKRENERLRQDLTRTQALTRAVQKAAGLQPSDDKTPKESIRRPRRATARALRAARELVPQASDPSRPSLPSASPLAVESPP